MNGKGYWVWCLIFMCVFSFFLLLSLSICSRERRSVCMYACVVTVAGGLEDIVFSLGADEGV